MQDLKPLFLKCASDPQFESENVSLRPLRGVQAEIIKRAEKHIRSKNGGVMTILSSRQTGKNETAAVLHKRHLWFNQGADFMRSWIRTAPTYKPQIVNSKKRLREIMKIDSKNIIHDPLFLRQKIIKEEGYIWRIGNASIEFISSGDNANVVGATASECLDMDEAHKVTKAKFDEDFAPFTANTNAGTLLWGVASDGLDTIEWYRQRNIEQGTPELNLYYPCDMWMDVHAPYRKHVESRVNALGWDHPIIKTQYRLISVSAEGRFMNDKQIRGLFDSDHEREHSPRYGKRYEALIDIAAGNEDFNPDSVMEGKEETATDSTVIWIYEVTNTIAQNNIFPVIKIVNVKWITGAALPNVEEEIRQTLEYWRIGKVTIDAVGVGRQIAESMEQIFGVSIIHKYIASESSVSEDCFDLQARMNFLSIKMFRNDGSDEWAEFERQCGWTKYTSNKGKMKLNKPDSMKHIDMVKALTYINQNQPIAGAHELYNVESEGI